MKRCPSDDKSLVFAAMLMPGVTGCDGKRNLAQAYKNNSCSTTEGTPKAAANQLDARLCASTRVCLTQRPAVLSCEHARRLREHGALLEDGDGLRKGTLDICGCLG